MSKFLMGAAAIAMIAGIGAANAQSASGGSASGSATQTEIDNLKAPPKTQNNTVTGAPAAKDSTKTTGAANSMTAPPQGTNQTPVGARNNPPPGMANDSDRVGGSPGNAQGGAAS